MKALSKASEKCIFNCFVRLDKVLHKKQKKEKKEEDLKKWKNSLDIV